MRRQGHRLEVRKHLREVRQGQTVIRRAMWESLQARGLTLLERLVAEAVKVPGPIHFRSDGLMKFVVWGAFQAEPKLLPEIEVSAPEDYVSRTRRIPLSFLAHTTSPSVRIPVYIAPGQESRAEAWAQQLWLKFRPYYDHAKRATWGRPDLHREFLPGVEAKCDPWLCALCGSRKHSYGIKVPQ